MAGFADAIPVGLLLWRAQLRMFWNQTVGSRKTGRIVLSVVAAIVIVLAWIWEGGLTALVVAASHRVAFRVDLLSLLSLAFVGYTAILIFSSLVFSLNALLLNPDLDLLLVSPRPAEGILGGRMVVQMIRLLLLGLLFTGPALLVLAFADHDPLIPFGFAALFLLYPVYVVVLVSLLSLLLVRIIPAGRGREVLAVLGVLLALGINLVNFLINPALRGSASFARRFRPGAFPDLSGFSNPWLPPGWAGRAASAMLAGNWLSALAWMAPLVALSAVVFTVGASLSGRLYLAGWIQAVRPRRRTARSQPARSGRRLSLLGPVAATMVVKDWRMRTRDVAQLIRFAMPVVFLVLVFVLRFPQLPSSIERLGQGPLPAMLGLIPAWILLFSLALSLGLSAVSLEGKSIWIYAASPNSWLDLLGAKCWSTALPISLLIGLVALAAQVVIRPGWLWAFIAVAVGIGLSAALSTVMVGLGAIFARFDWTDTRRMVNPAAVFCAMAVFGLVTGVTVVLLGISLALASATGVPLPTALLAAMLLALGGTIALAALSLLLGDQRLRALDLG